MNLEINLSPDKIILSLKKGKKTITACHWKDQGSLSKRLLKEIDLILRKNNIHSKEIRSVAIKSESSRLFTATRIVKSIGKAYSFAVQIIS